MKDAERWAAIHRKEIRMVMLTGTFLAICTLYFAGVNAYLLVHAKPRPFTLSFEQSASEHLAGLYHARIEWESMQKREAVRPKVFLDGAALAEERHQSAGADRDFSLSKTIRVEIDVPSGCATGLHRGRVVFDRAGGPEVLPAQLSTPVTIQVTGGFWTSWFLLRSWLILAALLGSTLYLYCVYYFPRPTGSLAILQRNGSSERPNRVILRMPFSALFLPWRRSSVTLSSVWKQARMKPASQFSGEVVFWFADLPILLVHWRRTPNELTRKMIDCYDLSEVEAADFVSCAAVDIMRENVVYKQGISESQYVLISYRSSKRML
jgi:hypothetical protein